MWTLTSRFEECLPRVLKHEGGFVDHPDDPGGATNKGITLGTYQRHYPNGTVDALRRIPDGQVAHIYKVDYWNKVKADSLPRGLDYAVFDFAVNSGPSRAAKFLQRLVQVDDDGVIGPKTLRAVQSHHAEVLIVRLCNARLEWLRRLRHWGTFGKGWERRVKGVKAAAVADTDDKKPVEQAQPKPVPWWVRLINALIGKD